MPSLDKAIVRALTYADIFDYPLTLEELYRFLITGRSAKKSFFKQAVRRMAASGEQVETEGEYYFLAGRRKIVKTRRKRKKWSRDKFKIANRVVRWFRFIPWVKAVAVSGALAVSNSTEKDDIDLLVVSAEKRLWLTRLLLVLTTELVANRRRPGDKNVQNKICLNMFLAENRLQLPKRERNLFTAHEVCQLKLLWEKEGIFQKFLKANQWVIRYLPNGLKERNKLSNREIKKNYFCRFPIIRLFNQLEYIAYRLQLAYMRSRKTQEVTVPDRILFHPGCLQKKILTEYTGRLKIN